MPTGNCKNGTLQEITINKLEKQTTQNYKSSKLQKTTETGNYKKIKIKK